MAHGYAKNGKTTKVRRPDVQLFHPGRHDVLLLASVLLAFPVLDACHIHAWRPTPSHPLFWTPLTSIRGVQFHLILYSGRHVHHSLASILPTFSILDACHVHVWRPFPSLPLFWTPVTSRRGVHFHLILSSGRHVHRSLASILSALSLLKPFNASENSNRSSTS